MGNDNPGSPAGVLCLDVKLHDAGARVAHNIERLGATVRRATCDLSTNTCFYSDTNELDSGLSTMAQKAINHGQMDIFGGVHVFSTDPLRFHVPLGTYMDHGRRTISVLECELDLAGLQLKIQFYFALMLLPLLLAFGALLSLASVFATRTKQLRSAVENLKFVMSCAKDSYILVNPNDIVVDANDEFSRMLHKDLDSIKGQSIKAFMDEGSRINYDAQKIKRRKGEPSDYHLTFHADNKAVKCVAYGAALPVPGEWRESYPYTFALITKQPDRPLASRPRNSV